MVVLAEKLRLRSIRPVVQARRLPEQSGPSKPLAQLAATTTARTAGKVVAVRVLLVHMVTAGLRLRPAGLLAALVALAILDLVALAASGPSKPETRTLMASPAVQTRMVAAVAAVAQASTA